jgi:hypothetical protein
VKNYIKGAWMCFKNYIVLEILFSLFFLPVINFGKDNLLTWIIIYSSIFYILQALLLYSDLHRLGIKEKKPQYDLNPYPLKGFVYGLLSIVPYGVLGLLGAFLTFQDPVAERAKHLVINTLLGPVYWMISLGHESALSYIIAVLTLAVICGLSYLGGNLGFYFNKKNKPGAMINNVKLRKNDKRRE